MAEDHDAATDVPGGCRGTRLRGRDDPAASGGLRPEGRRFAEQEQPCQELGDRFYDAVARDMSEVQKEGAERAKKPNYQRNLKRLAPLVVVAQDKAMIVEEAKYHWEVAAYYEKLKKKYQHAARYAWLRVEADPPRPRRKR
jgi:hypothetical protein